MFHKLKQAVEARRLFVDYRDELNREISEAEKEITELLKEILERKGVVS